MANEEKIKACYVIENDDKALSCIKDVVTAGKVEGGCQPRIVMLFKDGCPSCDLTKQKYKKELESGVIVPISIFSEEGLQIAKDNDIDGVPAVLVVDCKNRVILD